MEKDGKHTEPMDMGTRANDSVTNGVKWSGSETLAVIVPCKNEEESVPHFVDAMRKMEPSLASYLSASVRYVFIDDGSTDRTLPVLRSLSDENANVHFVSFARNFGKEAGLHAGISKALDIGATRLVVMDVDLQDPPSLIPDMFAKMEETDDTGEHWEMVSAYRTTRKGESPIRSAFARMFYRMTNAISEVHMKDGARDFRLFTDSVGRALVDLPERNRFSKGLFELVTSRETWLPYENIERDAGSSSWSFWKLVEYALDGITSFSIAPLLAVSGIGLVLFLLSLVFLVVIIVRALVWGDPVAGWPSLVVIITFFSSFTVLSSGVVGLYVGKIYQEVKQRPLYVIREER